MQLSVGFTLSPERFIQSQLNLQNGDFLHLEKSMNELKNTALDAFIYSDAHTQSLTEEWLSFPVFAQEAWGQIPAVKVSTFSMPEANLSQSEITGEHNPHDALSLGWQAQDPKAFYEQTQRLLKAWQMSQNLLSIEQLPEQAKYFQTLWKSQRELFFEELWQWLKKNLAPLDLNVSFHDVQMSSSKESAPKDQENGTYSSEANERKKQLTFRTLSGKTHPTARDVSSAEEKFLVNYLATWKPEAKVQEWTPRDGRFVFTVMIDGSPILIMAHLLNFTGLQLALLKGLFKAL